MTNPSLRRYVWLTEEQRQELTQVVEECAKKNPSDTVLELSAELSNLNKRQVSLPSVIQTLIKGLRMPKDILPVSLCDDAIDNISSTVSIQPTLLNLVKPAPEGLEGGE